MSIISVSMGQESDNFGRIFSESYKAEISVLVGHVFIFKLY